MRSLQFKLVRVNLMLKVCLAIVLFIYDTFLTFDQEVAYFWTAKRIGGASLLFFSNKWISMTIYVMGLVSYAYFPSDKVSSLSLSRGKSDQIRGVYAALQSL